MIFTERPEGEIFELPSLASRNGSARLAFAARAVLPAMAAAGRGRIINLSSGAAHRPLEGWSAYCAAKAGLAMLTRSLQLEYGEYGIRSFGFSPGVVDTGMQAEIRASGINPVSRLPRESLAPADEPATGIVYLCAAASDALAGQEFIDAREAHHAVNCMHDLKHAYDQLHDQVLQYYSDISNYIPRLRVDYFSL